MNAIPLWVLAIPPLASLAVLIYTVVRVARSQPPVPKGAAELLAQVSRQIADQAARGAITGHYTYSSSSEVTAAKDEKPAVVSVSMAHHP